MENLPQIQLKDGKKDFHLFILDLIYYAAEHDKSDNWINAKITCAFLESGIHMGNYMVNHMIKESVKFYRNKLKEKG